MPAGRSARQIVWATRYGPVANGGGGRLVPARRSGKVRRGDVARSDSGKPGCQRPQKRGTVSAPCAAMHASQSDWPLQSESFENRRRLWGVREIVHSLSEGFTRTQDIRLRQRDIARSALREQVAAKKGPSTQLHHQAALPRMRHVRRIEPPYCVAAKREFLAVHEWTRWPFREVFHRGHCRD